MLFLIVQATYTANLASILTAENMVLDGPQTLPELKRARVCALDHVIASGGERYWDPAKQTVIEVSGNKTMIVALAECEQLLMRGEVDAIVESEWMAHNFMIMAPGGCQRMRYPDLRFLAASWGLWAPAVGGINDTVFREIARAIVHMQTMKAYDELITTSFRLSQTCPSSGGTQVSVRQLGGAFVVFAVGLGTSVLLAVSMRGRVPLNRAGTAPAADGAAPAPTEAATAECKYTDAARSPPTRPLLINGAATTPPVHDLAALRTPSQQDLGASVAAVRAEVAAQKTLIEELRSSNAYLKYGRM
eukprot:TRINITY_DN20986_c0_g1_i2.p2 TRINITY_DN20986_c0_g1~~TRINITY_DN20986_c0_g1_i2.p2  ORF type:complete len:304 (+),score=57.55 TRINITY_DN20986_c0_g1_i2:737-1648(+)